MSDSSRPHGLQPTRLLRPWDFPGKSTRVGCHCLLRPRLVHIGKYCVSEPERNCVCRGSWKKKERWLLSDLPQGCSGSGGDCPPQPLSFAISLIVSAHFNQRRSDSPQTGEEPWEGSCGKSPFRPLFTWCLPRDACLNHVF